jgi:tRNA-2-methylthio-N6-dimethylallyladenosine synthase
MTKKLYIETVGCQMNVLDSELVVGSLRRQGYELVHEATEADVILFNTCSVRQHAEDKIYSALGCLRAHKKRHPAKILGVLGCMAQKDQELIRKRAPHVDIVCGTGQLARLPELIEEVKRTGMPQLALSLDRKEASRHEVEQSFESYDPLRDPSMRPSRFSGKPSTATSMSWAMAGVFSLPTCSSAFTTRPASSASSSSPISRAT